MSATAGRAQRRPWATAILVLVAFGFSTRAVAADAPEGDFWSSLKGIRLGPFALDIGGQTRLRYEYDDQFDVRGYAPGTTDQFLLTRILLDFDLRHDQGPRFFLQLRDAHAVGSHLGESDFKKSNPFEDALDVRQAFVEWLYAGGSPLGLRLGRQQISYGDQRVFGPGLWGNTGRYAWDAAMLKLDTECFWSDLWVGRFIRNLPQEWPNPAASGPTAFVAYGGVKRLPLRLDLFYAAKYDGSGETRGEDGPGDLVSHSVGFQAQGDALGFLDYTATFVHQFGRFGADTLRAYGVSAGLGLTLPLPWKPRVAGQFTWGSGDHDPRDGVHGTFDGVFGGADILFYGYLNLFFWANIRDHEIDLELRPATSLSLKAAYHYFTLDEPRDAWYTTGLAVKRRDASGQAGTELGHEIDLRVVWTPVAHLELMAGGGRFLPGAFVERTGAANPATWCFLQAAYTF